MSALLGATCLTTCQLAGVTPRIVSGPPKVYSSVRQVIVGTDVSKERFK